MKLEKSFSPVTEATAAGCRNASFYRLGSHPWTGTVTIEVGGVRRDFEVEELATVWKLTGPGGRTVTSPALGTALKKAGARP